MRKRLLVLALLVACHEPPTLAPGTYSLASVGGAPLPYPTSAGNLVSSVITIGKYQPFINQPFSETSETSSPLGGLIGHASGVILYRSAGMEFWANSDPSQRMYTAGTVNGDSLILNFYGQTRVFLRQP